MNYYNQFYAQKHEIVKVNGKGGAEAFQMAPNSQILLLDETQPIIWLKTTDGAGYPTLQPYTITPYEEPKPIDTNELIKRIEEIERKLSNEQSHTSSTKQKWNNKHNEHS